MNAPAWYQRFRKALAGAAAVAAVPGVLGILNLIPGIHIDAELFATITAIGGVLAGGGTVAAVGNVLSPADLTKAAAARGLGVIPDPPTEG